MTNCWSEGALRAWLDRELPAEDMKSVGAHLRECSACDALCTELAGRTARVFAQLEMLPEAAVAMRPGALPVRRASRWMWTGAAVALAAGLAVASFILPEKPQPAPLARALIRQAPLTSLVPLEPEPAAPESRPVAARVHRHRRTSAQTPDYFVALDDEPIESGVIMRVAVQPGNAQADIVFVPGGRPRAIRLVNSRN